MKEQKKIHFYTVYVW